MTRNYNYHVGVGPVAFDMANLLQFPRESRDGVYHSDYEARLAPIRIGRTFSSSAVSYYAPLRSIDYGVIGTSYNPRQAVTDTSSRNDYANHQCPL